MVRRERWLLSRDGRHINIRVNVGVAHSYNADLGFAYLAVADADTDQVIEAGSLQGRQ